MTTCGYHFSDGQRCNELIYRAADTPTGWRHEQGDESRGMCHFARREESGTQADTLARCSNPKCDYTFELPKLGQTLPGVVWQCPKCYGMDYHFTCDIPAAAQPGSGTVGEPEPESWRTIIVGLPIIRKLLNGEDVTLETFKINLLPDDVLFNARPARAILSATQDESLRELRELSEKATPGPWQFTEAPDEAWVAQTEASGGTLVCDPPEGRFKDYADRFRKDGPLIVACVNYVRSKLAALTLADEGGKQS